MGDTDWTAVWADVMEFLAAWRVPATVVGIILGAIVARWVLQFLVRRIVHRVVTGVKKSQGVEFTQELNASPLHAVRVVQRTRTLGNVFGNLITAVIVMVAFLVIINVTIPNVTGAFALITAAVGAGLGFGAQSLIKDILNGLFMVAEDQFGVGDIIDVGEASGVVESVGIRVTSIRSVDGTLWWVRNGEILRVGNMSQGWARAVIDLPVPYAANLDDVTATVLETATAMSESGEWRRKIMAKPEIWGVESISAEATVLRLVVKTRPSEQWGVARELRARLKSALDASGVSIPSLKRIVMDPAGNSAANGGTPKEK
ncbi:MAG: mechanosensitive ion channel [Cryobacterium sp.]|nr:mechanosensitive ion channel [Cryobacterium sp.]